MGCCCCSLPSRLRVRCAKSVLALAVKGRRPSAKASRSSNRGNDLTDLLARFEITVRIDNLVEWKDSIDDWFQLSLFKTVDHEIDCRLLPFRISAGRPDVVPFYRQELRD